MPLDPDDLIARLGLEPHPEGGWFRETWRAPVPDGSGERSAGTAIYFLLRPGERSHWHRVDAAEIWHHYAGGALRIGISPDGVARTDHVLGPDVAAGEAPQVIVPPGAWQDAEPGCRRGRAGGVHGVAGLRVRPLRPGPALLGARRHELTGAAAGRHAIGSQV